MPLNNGSCSKVCESANQGQVAREAGAVDTRGGGEDLVCVCVSTLCRDSWAVRKVDGFTVCVCVCEHACECKHRAEGSGG